MPNNEDQRAAAGILCNLSGFVITASLAMLAIEGALIAFVLGNRIAGWLYFVTSILAFLGFVVSIVLGGWGITKTVEMLANGTWKPSVASGLFNAQAGFAFLGLLFFLVSALLSGKPKETEIQGVLTTLSTKMQTLESDAEDAKKSDSKRSQQVETVSQNLERLERALNSRIDKIESHAKEDGKKRRQRQSRKSLNSGVKRSANSDLQMAPQSIRLLPAAVQR